MTGVSQKRLAFGVLASTLLVRLYWAAAAPLANDEAYYWDWSRALQLSFLDHPPGVAWLSWLGSHVASGMLGARLAVPFVHLLGVWGLWRCASLLHGGPLPRRSVLALLVFTELVPVFSLEGLLLLPDAGLLAALAWALLAWLKAAKSPPGQAWRWLLPAGLAIGAAGLCKYHAAPIAVGLSLGLLACFWRQRRLGEWLGFTVAVAAVALLVTTPVWWWNAQHHWASLHFQGAHGFAGLSLTPLAAARVYLGQLLLLTPLVLIGCVQAALHTGRLRREGALALVAVAGFWPLFALLELLAFGKQMLPHWVAPACWLLLPLLALRPWPTWAWRSNVGFAVLVTAVAPWLIAVPPLRQALVESFHGRPGPLSELTLWQPLAAVLNADPRLAASLRQDFVSGAPSSDGSCPQRPVLATLRWFWSAQLAFSLEGQPRLQSLDMNYLSYYSFRDDLSRFGGCAVLVIGDQRHLDGEQLGAAIVVEETLHLSVPSHQDTDVVVLRGHFRTREELATLLHGAS